MIVSEDFARAAWPGGSAIGKRISTRGEKGPYMTIVGVAREALTMGLTERKRPIVYRPQLQSPGVTDLTVLVRRSSPAADLGTPVRRIFRELDRDLPLYDVQSLAQYRYDRGAESRMGSTLLTIFGLPRAAAGDDRRVCRNGLRRQSAHARDRRPGSAWRRESADHPSLRRGGRPARFDRRGHRSRARRGVSQVLASVFLGLQVSDALTFMAGAIVLAAAAVTASWIPARRAARVDPMVAFAPSEPSFLRDD